MDRDTIEAVGVVGVFAVYFGHVSSSFLRGAIWYAACNAILYDPVLKVYYNKKRNEGKHHLTAVGAVARKLTYVIYAVMRDNKDYVPMPLGC